MADEELAPWDSPAPAATPEKPPWETTAEAATPEIEGEEPGVAERLLKGATSSARGAAEYIAPFLPTGPKQAEAGMPTSAKPAERKLKPREVSEESKIWGVDPVEFAGSMFNPVPMGVAYGLTKTAAPKLLQGGLVGGLTGLLEPTGKTVSDPGFIQAKSDQAMGGLAVGFGLTAGGKILSGSMKAVGNWILKDHPDMIMSKAVQTVLNQISRDEKFKGMSAKSAIDLVEATQSGTAGGRVVPKKPMVLADIANIEDNPPQTGVRDLSKKVASSPEGQQIALAELKARDKASPDRINADVGEYISSGPTAYQATKILTTHQMETAKPLYEATDRLQYIWSEHLANAFKLPDIQKGMNAGYHSERIHAHIRREPFDPTMLGLDLDVDGNVKLIKTPNMRVLDMAKRGLDSMIELERGIDGKLTSRGRDLVMLKNDFLAEVDALDTKGVYKKARQAWAGPAASRDAIKVGRAVFSLGPEEVKDIFDRMGAAEQEHVRIGLADIVKERIAKTGLKGDEAQAIVKNPWMQKQLRPIFKSESDFDDFINSVTKESMFFETFSRAKSAGRQEAPQGLSESIKTKALEIGQQVMWRHPLRAVGNLYRLNRDLGLRSNPAMNEALAKLLFAPEGAGILKNPPAAPQSRLHKAAKPVESFTPYLAALSGDTGQERPIDLPPVDVESRAAGGPVEAGQPYVVGEQGPEVIVPEQSGNVLPNAALPGRPDLLWDQTLPTMQTLAGEVFPWSQRQYVPPNVDPNSTDGKIGPGEMNALPEAMIDIASNIPSLGAKAGAGTLIKGMAAGPMAKSAGAAMKKISPEIVAAQGESYLNYAKDLGFKIPDWPASQTKAWNKWNQLVDKYSLTGDKNDIDYANWFVTGDTGELKSHWLTPGEAAKTTKSGFQANVDDAIDFLQTELKKLLGDPKPKDEYVNIIEDALSKPEKHTGSSPAELASLTKGIKHAAKTATIKMHKQADKILDDWETQKIKPMSTREWMQHKSGHKAEVPPVAEVLGFNPNTPLFKGGSKYKTGSYGKERTALSDPTKKNYERGHFFADDPAIAKEYGDWVSKYVAAPQNPAIIDMKGRHYSSEWMHALVERAHQRGYDMLVVKNMHDIGGWSEKGSEKLPQNQYIVLNPAIVRDPKAAFDPNKLDINHLLAGIAGAAFIPPTLAELNQTALDPMPDTPSPPTAPKSPWPPHPLNPSR